MASLKSHVSSGISATSLKASNGGETSLRAMGFLFALWLSLFVAVLFLATLIIVTLIDGAPKFSLNLFGEYSSSNPENAGARAAILGSVFVIATTAVLAIPLGVAAAVYLEEFANKRRWWNKMIELNVQNLAAVPSIVYGLLTLGLLTSLGVGSKNFVLAGGLALALLILPVIVIATREAIRSVPSEIRQGSLALGASAWQTVWRQVLPSSVPGISTGSILALSRAMGEAAPLLLLGALVYVAFDPATLMSGFTTLPIQIFSWSGRPQEGFHELAAAASILLLVLLLLMNGIAIFIRNRYQKRW